MDVERVTDLDFRPLLAAVVAPSEEVEITTAERFFVHWTRKEAILKATGDGLGVVPMAELAVGSAVGPSLISYPGRGELHVDLRDLEPGDGYAAAVAVLTGTATHVREQEGRTLLSEPSLAPRSAG